MDLTGWGPDVPVWCAAGGRRNGGRPLAATRPSEAPLHRGPIQGEHFEEVVPPGTRARFYGPLDQLYQLPATQRNGNTPVQLTPAGGR